MNLKQIAKTANVSLSTVSLVLNGKPGVKQETRERISKILQEEGYTLRSTPAASTVIQRNLLFIRYRGSGCLMESKDDFFIQIMDGIEYQARVSGFGLRILNANRNNLKEELLHASADAVGVILFATELELSLAPMLRCCPVPLVALDVMLPHERINTVSVENMDAMYQAVHYLHSLGHTKIGYLHSIEQTGAIPEREQGYYAAMRELGLEICPEFIHKLYLFIDRTYDQMSRILSENPPLPTAFVADNDVLAVGAMRALQDHGLRVPEDISIVGFDDSYICTIANPALTTIRSPKNAIGRTAVKRIQELLEDTGDTVIKARLCTELVERDSVAPLTSVL